MATLFALPFVAPPSMTVPWGNRSLLIYVGLYDVIPRTHNVNCPQYTYADQCWVSYGANVILVDTGGGFVSGYQPHDRCRYQTVVWGGCRW